ncbi:MAG: lamin tail domain-containing protein [Chitinophagaceae bacterium]|nr:lamin tail domain-containing protein [Chitinophagaceae bacterium]
MMKKVYLFVFSLIFSAASFAQVVISEIMYNPPESGTDSLEFIELYNAGNTPVNLNNHSFVWGGTIKRYTFTADTFLAPGSLFVLAVANANAVRRQYNLSFTPTVPTTASGLGNSGTSVKLLGAGDVLVDSVTYLNSWYSATNAGGSSLILCDPLADNTLSSNWAASNASTGNTINAILLKASPGVLEACSSLPVTWLTFTATNSQRNETILNWQVNEYNVKNYFIEQSNNGEYFEQLATVTSKGNGKNVYSFNTLKQVKENTYYRLKQVDVDGSFSYSKVVRVQNNRKTEFTIIGNPVKDVLTVNIDQTLLNDTFTLLNAEGTLLQIIKPQQTIVNINVSKYVSGTYFLRCSNGKSVRFIKM